MHIVVLSENGTDRLRNWVGQKAVHFLFASVRWSEKTRWLSLTDSFRLENLSLHRCLRIAIVLLVKQCNIVVVNLIGNGVRLVAIVGIRLVAIILVIHGPFILLIIRGLKIINTGANLL